MISERINILIASDINYAPYYGVMLTSLFEHNRESRFAVYLITDETWTAKETKKFEKLCGKYNSHFKALITDIFSIIDVPLNPNHHCNKATYYNILASKILPPEIDKIIYMDGDMIVQGKICKLWNIDMKDYAMAAVWDSMTFDDSTAERLGYDKRYAYVNNGTSVYNLAYWREHRIDKKAIEYMNAHPDTLTFMDQDVENAVLAGHITYLPITYNFQTMFLCEYFWKHFDDNFKNQVLETAKHPMIIHYNGGTKPWNWRYWKMPYRMEWLREYWKSPWWFAYQMKPIGKYLKHLVKRIVHRKKLIAAQQSQYISEAQQL